MIKSLILVLCLVLSCSKPAQPEDRSSIPKFDVSDREMYLLEEDHTTPWIQFLANEKMFKWWKLYNPTSETLRIWVTCDTYGVAWKPMWEDLWPGESRRWRIFTEGQEISCRVTSWQNQGK